MTKIPKDSFLNYFGQLRLYSIFDLILFTIALGSGALTFIGIILLHLGFLIYLETTHSHPYRKKFPSRIWILLALSGIILYPRIESVLFLLLGIIYTRKTIGMWGAISPLCRGFQYFFLAAGIVGYFSLIPWIALVAIFIRNFTGDLRDITKDRKNNIKTLPIIIGIRKDFKIYMVVLMITSFVWWSYTQLPLILLFLIFGIEIVTYNLTSR